MKLLMLVLYLICISTMPVFAHTLKVDGKIGGLLHIEPGDEPVAGELSRIFITLSDSTTNFDPAYCTCNLTISKDGSILKQFPIFKGKSYAPISYTFENQGVYDIQVKGKHQIDASFQQFKMNYQYYVKAGHLDYNDTKTLFITSNALQSYTILLAVVIGLAIVLMFLIPFQFAFSKPKNKLAMIPRITPYIRRIVYSISLLVAFAIFYHAVYTYPSQQHSLLIIMIHFGLAYLFGLFITLIPGLVYRYVPGFKLNSLIIHTRRALGVSAFFFGLIYFSCVYVFVLSGSAPSITFLSQKHQLAIVLGFFGFSISTALAATSYDRAVSRLGKKWKTLHKLVYVGIACAVLHTFLIGSYFTNPREAFPVVVNILSLVFLVLESAITLKMLRAKKRPTWQNAVYVLIITAFLMTAFYLSYAIHFTYSYSPYVHHM